ncbi:MAG TPA: ribosomal protein S18-alanine N-acetyltransferase [Pyrinomonadaceae bacterium]|nr:ribosomal protein S18-alanine N-acetyltransferase [Pyrinomonadaceae bacterium]
MTEHDLLEVVEIEKASGLSLWGWDAYHSELMQGSDALMFVARNLKSRDLHSGRIAGFIASRLVADELHVNNVAVRKEFRRLGIGRALLESVIEEGARRGARHAFLEVRAGNRAAQALYRRCGFSVAGLRKNYYSDPREDALVMSCEV